MTPSERRAIEERCDALIREFDAAHPEIALAVKMREAKLGENLSVKEGTGKQF